MSTDGAPTWLVRLTYQVPSEGGRYVDQLRQERCVAHATAHATARRWATQPLPAGAMDAQLEIEHRAEDGRLIRVEPWELGHAHSTAAETLEGARRHLRAVR